MAAKKASAGVDESKKLFEMSKQALGRMSDSRFKNDLEKLTAPEVQHFMKVRTLTPGQMKIAQVKIIKENNIKAAELEAKAAKEDATKVARAAKNKPKKATASRKAKKKGPPFWRGFTNWFSSFSSGSMVKRRTQETPDETPRIVRGPNMGLRGRVPVEYQISICEQVFGEGYILPGGAKRAKAITRPLLLTEGIKGLDLTAGIGGMQHALHDKSGLFLTLMEPNADVVAIAMARTAELPEPERRDIIAYNPVRLDLGGHQYDWAVAREMMFKVADKPGFLNSLQASMFSGGQIVITDLVLAADTDPNSETMILWQDSEKPPLYPITMSQYRALLEETNMEVHDFEDETTEYAMEIRQSWAKYVETIQSQSADEAFQQHILHEAEYWHSRLRAFESGELKLLRIRAIRKPSKDIDPETAADLK